MSKPDSEAFSLESLLKWLKGRWLGATAALLALSTQTLVGVFEEEISTIKQTISQPSLALRVFLLLLIACSWLAIKCFLLHKEIKSKEEKRHWRTIEARKSKSTFNVWQAYCFKCGMPINFHVLHEQAKCSANCGAEIGMYGHEVGKFLNDLQKLEPAKV